jgi:uncharacterized BrkB/YihY/UPF0761 family membrane protein
MRTTGIADETPVMVEVRQRGAGRLLADAARRFKDADGMSHARALAYQGMFAMMSGFIGMIGLASVLGISTIRNTIIELSKGIAPGPSGQLLQDAARQSTGGGAAAFFGLGAALISGALAMAQVERSGNRLAGTTEDRPGARRFLVALGLALTAGVLAVIGLVSLAGGQSLATGFGWKGTASDAWMVLRWILGIVAAGAGIYLLMRWAPRRPLGSSGQLMVGAVVSLVLWVLLTIALSLWFALSTTAQTYGPLVPVIALLLWAGATAIALHLGMAVTAELSSSGAPARSAGDGHDRRHVRVPDVASDRAV